MDYKLSAAEKAAIKQEVLAEIKEKKLAFVNPDKMFKKRVADREYKTKLAALKARGELKFRDLFRVR